MRIDQTFRDLEEQAIAAHVLPDVASELRSARENSPREWWKDGEGARLRIKLAQAMYVARRISFQEYVFMVSHAVESVHDQRIFNKAIPELERISNAMRDVEQAHGLKDNEYWKVGDAPAEYQRLNRRWSRVERQEFFHTLAELEKQEAARLYSRDRSEFDRLRERGRRALFHKDEFVPALVDVVKRYEREAKLAAQAGAYTAAIALIAAAVEGLLILRCLRSRSKAARAAKSLPARLRPRDVTDPTRWTFESLIDVCALAGWLPQIEGNAITVKPDGMAHVLRNLRNAIHPGRVAMERPWVEAEKRDYDDAEAIYSTLFATIHRRSALMTHFAREG